MSDFNTKPGFVEKRLKLQREYIERLADEAYEGCDGCTEFEEKMWKEGFVMGYYKAEEKEDEKNGLYEPTLEEKRQRKGEERMFNYYFEVGAEVMLDEEMIPEDETFSPIGPLRPYLGKKGIVKSLGSDLHAFGRGSSYHMDVDFDGELVKNVFASDLIEWKDE